MPAQRNLILMTGTPITTVDDAYGYISLINPNAYASKSMFDAIHVPDRDFYGSATQIANEELLNHNFMLNCARVFRREIDQNLPEVSYEPIFYELHKDHYAKYQLIAEQALLEVENNEQIDFLTQSAINNALQQIIVGYEQYFETPEARQAARKKVAAFELLDEVMAAMGSRKLIVFCYYQKAIAAVTEHGQQYGAVAINGAMTSKQREENLERFMTDPNCRLLVGQPLSMGAGLDGLKDVCHEILFLEMPMVAKDFIQAVGRIDRNGQKNRCRVMLATAINTLQVRRQERLLDKDEQANKIQNPKSISKQDLRDWIYGK